MPVISKMYKVFSPRILILSLFLVTSFSSVQAESHSPRTVKAIGTLTAIVNKNYIDADVSKNQIMVAILAANPDAFKGGNINYMIRNADLKLPSVGSIQHISNRDATNLLNEHYRLFKRGRTGNLPPPNFISLNQSGQVETLVKEKQEQAEKLNSVEAEREELREKVKRLEEEKAKRDSDLQGLEDQIQDLQLPSSSLNSASADLRRKLASGELSGEEAKLLEELDETNINLSAQLQSARSEVAESERMEITLERRINDIQEENSKLAEALKEKGVSPTDVIQKSQNSRPTQNTTTNTQQPTQETTAVVNENTVANASGESEGSLFDQYLGFIPKDFRWLIWLLPLFLLFGLLWLIWKMLRGGKGKTARRVQQPANTAAFADYNQPIDPEVEIEQEPQLEVSIKLDVARAYIEAGDAPAAREMLAEVIREGNEAQQQEASRLIAGL